MQESCATCPSVLLCRESTMVVKCYLCGKLEVIRIPVEDEVIVAVGRGLGLGSDFGYTPLYAVSQPISVADDCLLLIQQQPKRMMICPACDKKHDLPRTSEVML